MSSIVSLIVGAVFGFMVAAIVSAGDDDDTGGSNE